MATATAEPGRLVPLLEHGACQVWWARPTGHPAALERLLDPTDRARRDRLRRVDDRNRLTVGVALARLVLAGHLGRPAERLRFDRTCRACGRPHGKPHLTDNPAGLQFSIAHAGCRVAVAVVWGAPVGVDVEQLRATLELEVDALAAHVLSPAERAAFEQVPPGDRASALLAYWTRKEALLKATGDGLRIPMGTITVSAPHEPPRLRRWTATSRPSLPVGLRRLHPGSGYLACVAVLGLATVRVQELDAVQLLAAASAP
jgi:4'-phosphopantetheinyl transferase